MGKIETINLNKCYRELVHVPLIKNSLNRSPLYALSDSASTAEEIKGLTRDREWLMECTKSYNSPTNVRKIFLSCNKVTLQFYKPYIVNGKESSEGKWREREVDSQVHKGIAEICAFENSQGRDLAYNGDSLPNYRFSGSMLQCIRQPWVLSNLEEIYIDTTCLFSEKLMAKLGKQRIVRMVENCDVSALKKLIQPIICLLVGVKDVNILLEQFQRLRIIGIIPELNELQRNGQIKQYCDKGNSPFIAEAIQNGVISKDSVAYYLTPKAGKLDTGKLVTRNYYLFDKTILSKYERELQRKVKEDLESKLEQTKEEQKRILEESKTQLERELDRIEKAQGFEKALTTLRITVSFLTPEKKKDIYNSFTNEAKSKYNQILNG